MSSFPGSRSALLASETWFGSTAYGIAQGFRRLGWDVHEVDTAHWFPMYRTTALRIARRVLKPLAIREFNAELRSRIDQLRPTALITVKGRYLQPETLEYAARAGVTTINYYPDVNFDHPGLDPATLGVYDRIFTTKTFHIDWLTRQLGRANVTYLPHGYSPDVHRPVDAVGESPSVDVVYIGTYSPYKERWLAALRAAAPDVGLAIFGDLWTENLRTPALRSCVRQHGVFGTAYCRSIASARICLAIHSGPDEATGWEDSVSTRTFEIPACRGFMLHIDNDEVRALFAKGEEFDVFASEDELVARVTHYLPREKERAEMASRAYARAVPAYSYDARVATISQWLDGLAVAR